MHGYALKCTKCKKKDKKKKKRKKKKKILQEKKVNYPVLPKLKVREKTMILRTQMIFVHLPLKRVFFIHSFLYLSSTIHFLINFYHYFSFITTFNYGFQIIKFHFSPYEIAKEMLKMLTLVTKM